MSIATVATRTITRITVILDDDPRTFLGEPDLTTPIDARASFDRFADLAGAAIRTGWTECATADITVTGTRGSGTIVTVQTALAFDPSGKPSTDAIMTLLDDAEGLADELEDAIAAMIGGLWESSWGEGGNTWVVGTDGSTGVGVGVGGGA